MGDSTSDIEQIYNAEAGEERCEEQSFSKPSWWWFAGTGFPLIAGTAGPLASAMNICALTQNWAVYVPPGQSEEHAIEVASPWWCTAINGVSLVCALVANIALLLRMARRLSFPLANTISIVAWFISCFLLTALILVIPARLPGDLLQQHPLSQSFYYAIIAAVLYFIITILLLFAVYATCLERHRNEFKLTVNQRTLMLQTMIFLIYLLAGAAVYSRTEGWQFLDALYWADYTLLTVGLGNYSPASHVGRILLLFYATGGIITLGLLVQSIRTMGIDQGKRQLSNRILEDEREKMIRRQGSLDSRGHKEFNLMREVQKMADRKRRWAFFFVACTAWLFLWFFGAAVFWHTERSQHWTYFESLYFAYVSLMTIGYGELFPQSNAGKPFYVIWTLLAVPIISILVSSLEGTIVRLIRQAAILVGELMILPGEVDARTRIRSLWTQKPQVNGHTEESESVHRSSRDVEGETDVGNSDIARQGGRKGSSLSHQKLHRLCLMTQHMLKLMNDMHTSPPKRYKYEEWMSFLDLMGDAKSSPSFGNGAVLKHWHESIVAHTGNGHASVNRWRWLGNRSVLMADEAEAEWILRRLCVTLDSELKEALVPTMYAYKNRDSSGSV